MMKTLRVLLCSAVLLAGCNKGEPTPPTPPPTPEPKENTPNTSVPESPKKEEPKSDSKKSLSFTAEQFAADNDKPWQQMIKKFGRKPFEVSGEIKSIGTNIAHAAFIELKVEGSTAAVRCYTADPKPWNTVLPGQKVTLQGTYPPEFGFGHILQKSKLTNTGPKPSNELNAEKFAKDCAANPEDMHRKYKGKNIVLRGKVASFAMDNFGSGTLVLVGPAQPTLKIDCPQFELFSGKKLNPGDDVSLLVDCEFVRPEIVYMTGGKVLQK